MVVVVGKTPAEIRVTRDQYIELISVLDQATRGTCPHEAELAYKILDETGRWLARNDVPNQVDGQLELPLEWDQSAAR